MGGTEASHSNLVALKKSRADAGLSVPCPYVRYQDCDIPESFLDTTLQHEKALYRLLVTSSVY
jgi:hypothetical protein